MGLHSFPPRKNRSLRRWSTAAWSCSHLNREAPGSVKQKCNEDQEHLQIHSPVLTDHQRVSLSLPVQEHCRQIYQQSLLCRGGKPAPANGNPSRKQTSFAASIAGLASGHLWCCAIAVTVICSIPRLHAVIHAALQSWISLMFVLPCTSSVSWRIFL